MPILKYIILTLCYCATATEMLAQPMPTINTQVLVVGAGTGGTAAALQAAQCGAKVYLIEPTSWLGGMISAAGVSATDGNNNLAGGIWGLFRNSIYQVYGGAKAVETGWVSNTHFEPHVADSIFKTMAAAQANLTIKYNWQFEKAIFKKNKVTGAIFITENKKRVQILANIIIDATELGDVMASANVPFSLGMEADAESGEKVGVNKSNNIVQDITYVAILKDYGIGTNHTILKPIGYTANEFDGACTDYYVDKTIKAPNVNAKKMLDYARLPNNKYMLNWPNRGNDTYLNIVPLTNQARTIALQKAKQTTLRFIYFIQTQLGYKNLGLANDEFATADKLALMPYYREGRRVKGLVRFTINNIAKPYDGNPLYRTGISVGDYPIDHHHKKNEAAPQHLEFFAVPSYSIPIGSLIPANTQGLIIAEKGISVSNVVNGSTRLQPVVMGTGQAAGTLAALAVLQQIQPSQVSIREVQKKLLQQGAYLMPFIDAPTTHAHFAAIQKIALTGILRGTGIPYKWANQTWFYPDSLVNAKLFAQDIAAVMGALIVFENEYLSVNDIFNTIQFYLKKDINADNKLTMWTNIKLLNYDINRPIKRFEAAAMIDYYLQPFEVPIDYEGKFKTLKTQ